MNIEKITRFVKHTKTELADGALAPEDDAMPPIVVWGREGKTVAVCFVKNVVRDDGLEAMYYGIRGFAADEVILVCDSHIKMKLGDGELPEPGSMQRQCEAGCGSHPPDVLDCVIMARATRSGDLELMPIPYHVDYDIGELHWDKTELVEGLYEDMRKHDASYEGVIPDAIRFSFSHSTLDEILDDADDPVIQSVMKIIDMENLANEVIKREFFDDIISQLIQNHVECTVVMARENADAFEKDGS